MKQSRSAAQCAASRVNGARSRGPRSAAARSASSLNAVKHGLFRAQPLEAAALSGPITAVVLELQQREIHGLGAMHLDTALLAAARLEEAAAIARHLRKHIAASIASAEPDTSFVGLIVQLVRVTRYQRRFRGQRDRALRAISVPAADRLDSGLAA